MCLRRWEPARLPGPGRRAHKDRDVSRPGSSGPGTGSIGHPEFSGSRGGGGRAGRASSRTRAPAPARPRHSPRVLGFLKIQEPRGEHRGGSIGLQPGAPNSERPRGGSSRSAGGGRGRPGAAGGARSRAGAEPGAADAKSEQMVAGGAGGLRANRLSPRGPGPLPARGGPLPALLGGGGPGGGVGAPGGASECSPFPLTPRAPSSRSSSSQKTAC